MAKENINSKEALKKSYKREQQYMGQQADAELSYHLLNPILERRKRDLRREMRKESRKRGSK